MSDRTSGEARMDQATARREDREAVAVLQQQMADMRADMKTILASMQVVQSILDQQRGGMKVLRALLWILGTFGSIGIIEWLLGLVKGHP